MKPYRIEIFDRQFNFRLNALVDSTDFVFKYDILSPEKNTINLPLDIKTRVTANAGTPGDGTICTSDYVRIIAGKYEYTGVITKIEKNEYYTVVTYMDALFLFNHETFIKTDDVKLSYVEDYLYRLLAQEFISTSDESQKIYGLTITKTSQTVGTFDYCLTEDTYTIINLLNDYISPAYRDFIILTDVSVDISNKTVNVSIGKIDETDTKTIEGDLPNVIKSDYVIRQANDNKNKLELIDIYNNQYTKYNFYLHASDYSFNSIDTDRITPVINDVEEFNSSIITEEAFWSPYNEALQTITKYNDPSKTLTEGEKGLLMSAFQFVFSIYRTYAINNYTGEWLSNQIGSDIISEALSGNLADGPLIIGMRYGAYQYNWTDQEMLAYYPANPYYPFTIRNAHAKETYDYSWDSVGYWSGDAYKWTLTDHGAGSGSNFGTCLYRINGDTSASAVEAHLKIDIPIWFYVAALYYTGATSYSVHEWVQLQAIIKHSITTSEISSALNDYRQSPEYQAAYQRYKTEKFAELLEAYANKIFKTSKYTNNIEITVPADDGMIKPLDMKIGQVVHIIHEGVSYNSILSGKEIQQNGLVRLVFGTIRLELTKLLNMKGI